MKKAIYYFLFAIIVALLSACFKPKGNFTLKAQIIDQCNGNPLANVKVRIYIYKLNNFPPNKETLSEASTDENGFVILNNIPLKNARNFIMTIGGYEIVDGRGLKQTPSANDTVYISQIYQQVKAYGKIHVKVNNINANNRDTLHIGRFKTPNFSIFPIKDTVITIEYDDYTRIGYLMENTDQLSFVWGISDRHYQQMFETEKPRDYNARQYNINFQLCQMPAATEMNVFK